MTRADIHLLHLCKEIIKETFGDIVNDVCSVLLSCGRCNLGLIIKKSQKSPKKVKESLFVLIHHGLVTFTESVEGVRVVVYYQVAPKLILMRNQFPLYLDAIASKYGTMAESILWIILKNGKCQYQMIQEATQCSFETFLKLVKDGFIVKCSLEDMNTEMDKLIAEEADAIDKKGTLLTSAELTKLKKELQFKRQLKTGTKRKWAALQDDQDEIQQNDMSFYRVNYERIHLHYRNAELLKLTETSMNASASKIMESMLNESIASIEAPDMTMTKLSTLIPSDLQLPIQGGSKHHLLEYLDILAGEEFNFLVKVDESGGGRYHLNIPIMVETLRRKILESMIQEKWGIIGLRIWRLLHLKNKLEEKQIAKLAMILQKTGRDCLYKMLKEGFVFLQDVPKTADHSASRTIFLWYTNVSKTLDLIIRKCYKSISNLKQRMRKELESRKLLMEKTKRLDVISGQAKLSEADQQGLDQLNAIRCRLLQAEFRLEYLVLILRDI